MGDDFLHRQLIKLGDMMGDGEHLEPGGKWISRDYKMIAKALGLWPKQKRRKPDAKVINGMMAERVRDVKCSCGGELVQTRSGSFRAKCKDCGKKYTLLKRGRKGKS